MLTNLLSRALMMSTPLLFGSISEVYAERAGMMNTAIEGIFLVGAWGGFVGTYISGSLFVGCVTAMFCGVTIAAVYGFITITLQQHQVVTGTALNILAVGLCSFFYRVIFGTPIIPLTVEPLQNIALPFLCNIPIVGQILFKQNILTYIIFAIIPIAHVVLYKTSIGLVIRSAGENPEAVAVAGVSVNAVRFCVILLSGLMGGLAGAYYSIGYLGLFATNIINGRGWIAFAICFLGNWTPKGALIGTLIFGVAEALAIYMQSRGSVNILPNELFIALPYVLTILLTVSRRSFNVPAKLGTPYIREN